jgi:hypothetical protein
MRRPDEIRLYWEWRDGWFGYFFDPQPERTRLYVCVIPYLPIRFTWEKGGT